MVKGETEMYRNDDIDYLRYLKTKKVYIWGAGKQGKRCFHKLKNNEIDVYGFIDNDEEKVGTQINGVMISKFTEFLQINDNEKMIVICSRQERGIKQQLLDNSVFNFISESQIDFGGGEEYYGAQYFEWQRRMGEFGGRIKKNMFESYIRPEMTVLEFGSGGGYLLKELKAKTKLGIEVNEVARKNAESIGVSSVRTIREVPDEFADIIISTSVLEHVENPLGSLKELRSKLKVGGLIVFHVPNESCETEYKRSEINNHLFTWNCLNLGNLFKAAGFFVISVERIQEIWPKYYQKIEKEVGSELFEVLCEMGGKAYDANRCLIVASRTS